MSDKRTRKSKSDPAAKHIARLWGDVPVIDAEKELRVFMRQEDVDGAERKNPACCVFARACQRLYGSTKVLFLRRIAYVELPDGNGQRQVQRFWMGDGMRKLIDMFDRGETLLPEGGFILSPPPKHQRLDALHNRNKARQREWAKKKREALLKGERRGQQGKGAYDDKPIEIDLSVRTGTGMVQFKNAGPKISRLPRPHEIASRARAAITNNPQES